MTSWSWLNEPSWSLSGDNKGLWSSSSRWLRSPVDLSSSTTTWSWLSYDEGEEQTFSPLSSSNSYSNQSCCRYGSSKHSTLGPEAQ
jgi:hypothetical protein